MRYLEIQGMRVPALGLGTWQLEGRTCLRAVEEGLRLGYRHIDTAQLYGNEEEVGRAISSSGVPRGEIFLTTKVWTEGLDFGNVLRTTDGSLRRLGTDYVDLLLVHWPNPEIPLEETLSALQQLQEEGRALQIGVSNFPPSLLRQALEIVFPLFCIQVEYHPFLSQEVLLDMARRHDLMFTAYSPLARGEVAKDPTLKEIAQRHGKTPAQVTLRWLMQQDHVAAIPKASTPEHLRANLEVFDFVLSDEEMQQIFALDRGRRLINPGMAPDWER
jgi:2,5-diketo-D-gluconate reductase B